MTDKVNLRKGKIKTTLSASIDAALLAVEIYNKPRTSFRTEGYISLMIMAWTRLYHSFFHTTIGDKYYYKKRGTNIYERIDGEKKAWDLQKCIKEYKKLDGKIEAGLPYFQLTQAIEANLIFFIGLRNKIEHRHIAGREIDLHVFGECQSFLFNYETMITSIFGNEYAVSSALVYSLQFAHLRTTEQSRSNKSALSKDIANLYEYIDRYRTGLPDEIFKQQEYSIKLLQIPKLSNTNRADAAIEFVRWDSLSDDEKAEMERLVGIVKDRAVKVEGLNVGRLRLGQVKDQVNNQVPNTNLNPQNLVDLWKIFQIRPNSDAEDPFETNTNYCHFDEVHKDYVYQDNWVNFIVQLVQRPDFDFLNVRSALRQGETWDITEFGGVN